MLMYIYIYTFWHLVLSGKCKTWTVDSWTGLMDWTRGLMGNRQGSTYEVVLPRYRKFYIVCRGCLYRDISYITI